MGGALLLHGEERKIHILAPAIFKSRAPASVWVIDKDAKFIDYDLYFQQKSWTGKKIWHEQEFLSRSIKKWCFIVCRLLLTQKACSLINESSKVTLMIHHIWVPTSHDDEKTGIKGKADTKALGECMDKIKNSDSGLGLYIWWFFKFFRNKL